MRALAVLASLPFAFDLLDRFLAWARAKYRVQIDEGGEYPDFRLWAWIRVMHWEPRYDHDVLIIRLPSYHWGQDYSWYDRWRWFQRVLMWRGPFIDRSMQDKRSIGWTTRMIPTRDI